MAKESFEADNPDEGLAGLRGARKQALNVTPGAEEEALSGGGIHGIHDETGPYSATAHDQAAVLQDPQTGELTKDKKLLQDVADPALKLKCDYIPGGVAGRHNKFSTCNNDATHFAFTAASGDSEEDAGDVLSTGKDHRSYLTCEKHAKQAEADLSSERGTQIVGRSVPIEKVRNARSALAGVYKLAEVANRVKTVLKGRGKAVEVEPEAPVQKEAPQTWVENIEQSKQLDKETRLQHSRMRAEARERVANGEDPETVFGELKEKLNPKDPNAEPKAPGRRGRRVTVAGTGAYGPEAEATSYSVNRALAAFSIPETQGTTNLEKGDEVAEAGRTERALTGLHMALAFHPEIADINTPEEMSAAIDAGKLPESLRDKAKMSEIRTVNPEKGFTPVVHPPMDDMSTISSKPLRLAPALIETQRQDYEERATGKVRMKKDLTRFRRVESVASAAAREARIRARGVDVSSRRNDESTSAGPVIRPAWHSAMEPKEAATARMTIKASPDGKGTPLVWDPATKTAKIVEMKPAGRASTGDMMHTYEPTDVSYPMPFAHDDFLSREEHLQEDPLHEPDMSNPTSRNFHFFRNLPELGSAGSSRPVWSPGDPQDKAHEFLGKPKTDETEEAKWEEVPYKTIKRNTDGSSTERIRPRAARRPYFGDPSEGWEGDVSRKRTELLTQLSTSLGPDWWRSKGVGVPLEPEAPAPSPGKRRGRMSDEEYNNSLDLLRSSGHGDIIRDHPFDWEKHIPQEHHDYINKFLREFGKRDKEEQAAQKALEAQRRLAAKPQHGELVTKVFDPEELAKQKREAAEKEAKDKAARHEAYLADIQAKAEARAAEIAEKQAWKEQQEQKAQEEARNRKQTELGSGQFKA